MFARTLPQFSVCLAMGLVCTLSVDSAHGRIWSSLKGSFQIEAEAIAFSDHLVVLKRPTGDLVAVELDELSLEDQEYVKSKEMSDTVRKSANEMQVWTAKDGLKVRGRVVAFGRKELVFQRRFGKIQIDGKDFSSIDPLHQRLVLKILSHLEGQTIEDEKQLQEWGKSLGAAPKSYKLEGVLLQLEGGEEIGVPFFMFSPEDLAILQPGWEVWKEREESDKEREQESFLVRSAAQAYQQDRAAQRQIEMLKLDLLGAASGVIAIWEVGLVPRPGVYGRPTSVMVPAQNSQIATEIALRNYPAYILVGVRRASR